MIRYTKHYRIKLAIAHLKDFFCILFFNKEFGFSADFYEKEILLGIDVRSKQRTIK
jgi:hypothetical protein